MTIDPIQKVVTRRVEGIWEVFGKVGGIVNVITLISSYFLGKYSLLCFKIEAINEFFESKSENKNVFDKNNKIGISFG